VALGKNQRGKANWSMNKLPNEFYRIQKREVKGETASLRGPSPKFNKVGQEGAQKEPHNSMDLLFSTPF